MRLFVAVDLENEVREKIYELSKALSSIRGIKTVEKENLHITLKFLGEVSDVKAERIKSQLESIEAEKFKAHFYNIGFFPPKGKIRVIWVGVEEGKENFKDLALKVENSLKKLGFKKDKEFVAHATVARVKKPINRDELIQVLESFENDFGWLNVDKFKLKQSILTQKGPIYKDIRVYDLK
ncbi:MAG: RNA 2',3'-cyclic phosphodiesterase [Archaeoglobaceae archaeon]|nr:RNA 2',3'-cyclic phosphodiesterase [Archaeoglobaceae archaeon]